MKLLAIRIPDDLPPAVFERLLSFLPQEAQDRVRRFRLREDAIRSLVARLCLTWYLRSESLLPPTNFATTARGHKGKPYLVKPALDPSLAHNDSHDGAYVLLGVHCGRGVEVGVDLMQLPEGPKDVLEGISDQLTHAEKSALALPLAPQNLAKRLTTLWTLKEGYVKATGDGVGFGLERIAVEMDDGGRVWGVSVDGSGVEAIGWKWAHGFFEGRPVSREKEAARRGEEKGQAANGSWEEEYGWAAYWKEEYDGPETGHPTTEGQKLEVEMVQWDDFLSQFPPD